MKTLSILLRLGFVGSLFPMLLFGQSKLSVAGGTKFSFGNLYTTKKVEKAIALRNLGSDTLFITDVAAACGCTAAMVSNSRIAPRDSGMLSITFDASRFNGWIEKTVGFRTNDPAQPYISIAFTANIIKVFEVDPDYIMFSHAKVDSEMTEEITFKNISTSPIRFLSVTTSSNIITVNIENKVVAPNQEATVTCVLHPREAGTYKGNIEFKTDNAQMPSLQRQVLCVCERWPGIRAGKVTIPAAIIAPNITSKGFTT